MRKMDFEDKANYCAYRFQLGDLLVLFVSFVFSEVFIAITRRNPFEPAALLFPAFALAFMIFSFGKDFVVLFSKAYVDDGEIYKKHRFVESDSEGTTITYKAKARTYDEKYYTDWDRYRKKYMKYKNVPVKIVFIKNKPYSFYIENKRFMNEDNLC